MAQPVGAGDSRDDAIKRIRRKRMFQQQLFIYVLINLLLWVIWAATGFGFPWPIFVTVFWGLGLVTQGWTIYRGAKPITEAEIQREMGKDTGTA